MKTILSKQKRKTEAVTTEKPVALSVKIDQRCMCASACYVLGNGRPLKEILAEALNEYLDRVEMRK